jgi:hypothetical protein
MLVGAGSLSTPPGNLISQIKQFLNHWRCDVRMFLKSRWGEKSQYHMNSLCRFTLLGTYKSQYHMNSSCRFTLLGTYKSQYHMNSSCWFTLLGTHTHTHTRLWWNYAFSWVCNTLPLEVAWTLWTKLRWSSCFPNRILGLFQTNFKRLKYFWTSWANQHLLHSSHGKNQCWVALYFYE